MYFPEIYYPGTFLDISNKEQSTEISVMLYFLESRVIEAAISLILFDQFSISKIMDLWETERKIHNQVLREIQEEVGIEKFTSNLNHYQIETKRRAIKRLAESEIMPKSYTLKIPFIYAHSFTFAVDSFGKFLDEIGEYEITPEIFKYVRDDFNNRLPMIGKIRNSAFHVEDRARRYASIKDKKAGFRIQLTDNLSLGNLYGNNLNYTIDDGTQQSISISVETLKILVDILNKALASFPWTGPPHICP